MYSRIHIFGASGSGATTLGSRLGVVLGIPHLDTDNYYWQETDPPFVEKNSPEERVEMIRLETQSVDSWILSGSLCSWGECFLDDFTLAVLLLINSEIRMQRLSDRERQRYGDRILPGGDMRQQHIDFMSWAECYDTAKAPVRSLDLHESWLTRLNCPVLKLDSNQSIDALVQEVLRAAA